MERSTPDPGYERGRNDDERAAFWAEIAADEEARRAVWRERWKSALALVAFFVAVIIAMMAVVLGLAVLSVALGAVGLVPTLLIAIFVVLCVIAARVGKKV